jgi:Icc-related predicted phosphoesterase
MKPTHHPAIRGIAISAIAAALLFVGCKKEEKAASPVTPPRASAEQILPPKATAPEQIAAAECAGPVELAPPQQVQFGDRTATLAGYKLTFAEGGADGKLVLGVLGPLNEDSGANLVNIKKFNAFFKAQNADAIVVTGDVGETQSGIARALSAVAESGLPVLVISGNRECRADFTNGILDAQKTFANVVNMNQVRSVQFPAATLVSLPGYHDQDYLSCESGCLYFKSTVNDVVRMAKEATSPVVMISHGPPRGEGSQALDYASSGGNVGDAEINRAIAEASIPFGLFSNIKEAGGRAVDSASGTTLVKEGAKVKSLFLNPGPADSVGWEMNDSTKSAGMAAVFTIEGNEASWTAFRAPAHTAAEKTLARTLERAAEQIAAPTTP